MRENLFQCPYCGVGCGLLTNRGKQKDDPLFEEEVVPAELKVRGDPDHPANRGLVCLKGLTVPQTLDKNRLTTPLYRPRPSEPLRPISWGEAYRILAEKLGSLSPDEVYFYLSGQLTTEDAYAANKFAKGFLRTNNVDANSRLCMASAVVAYKMAFGSDGPPCSYEDLDDADVFIFWGSNAAVAHPVLFNRLQRRRRPDSVFVTVDPVESETAKRSEVFIRINAGTDAVLLNSVLFVLYRSGWIDGAFVKNYTEGFERAIEEAKKYPPEVAERVCGVRRRDVELLAYLFANAKKLVSFWAMGLNQSVNGVYKNLALINLHLATGRVGKRGCPFSLTGQPNAMGGREVGYLSGGLPGYRSVENEAERREVERLWGVEGIRPKPGPTITEAVDLILEGRIKLLWVVGTNPAVTLPRLDKVWKALKKVFLVVNEAYADADTLRFADLVLPVQVLPEKEGTMTGSDRTMTLSRPQVSPPEGTKPDWLVFTELARLMGGERLFPYRSAAEIFEEFKRLTAGRLCDASKLRREELPARWGPPRLYELPEGGFRFATPSGRARFYPAPFEIADFDRERVLREGLLAQLGEGEFILTTGRIKNQWHTMTKTGKVETLTRHELPPFVILHPKDAAELGVDEWDLVELDDGRRSVVRAVVFGRIQRRHVFTYFGYPLSWVRDPVNLLVEDRVDPLSKEPDLKFRRVKVRLYRKTRMGEL
ncbi:MAG: molybdopterin-dependent oxidoreductase [Aquificae bacterium]|nr:molybdopterin-dependent oxidoreductase [Aquificota bacterium]